MITLLSRFATLASKGPKKEFVTITPRALSRLREIFDARSNPSDKTGVKISLTRRGCNGLSYVMNYVDKPDKFDQVIERDGMKIVLDSKALMAMVGTELDYVQEQISSQFVFNNPNEKGRCGCGQSFHM